MAFSLSASDDEIWKQFIQDLENQEDPIDVTIGGDTTYFDPFSEQFSTFEVPQIPVLAGSQGEEGYLDVPAPVTVPLLDPPFESAPSPPLVKGADPASMNAKDEVLERLSNQ